MEKDKKAKSKKSKVQKTSKVSNTKSVKKIEKENKEEKVVEEEKEILLDKDEVKEEATVEVESKEEKKVAASTDKKKRRIYYSTTEQTEVKKFVIVILVVLLCVVGVYFLTRIFVTKDLLNKKEEEKVEEVIPGEVNYDMAIIGTIMNRPYDDYYVAIYDLSGDYAYDMGTMIKSFTDANKDKKDKKIYKVDLSSELNKSYYKPEEVNEKATGVSDLKVGDITLLRIKRTKNRDGSYTYKINKYITELDAMKKELGV